jgi:5-formyltetrahydrofolate cyclo-ligase
VNAVVPSHRLERAKRALRREILARRDALAPRDRAAMSLAVAEHLLALPELRAEGTAMAFWSFGSEVDTRPVLERLAGRGVRIALPRVAGADLVPVVFEPGDALVATAFGTREPAGGTALAPRDLDVVITPGVAFDGEGFRVGYGGGFYDRLFRRLGTGAFRVAVGFSLQVVDRVPRGGGDLPVDAVVTEEGVLRCRGA